MKKLDRKTGVFSVMLSLTILIQSSPFQTLEVNADGSQGCWATPTVPASGSACSCQLGYFGPLPDYHCGSQGFSRRSFKTCRPAGAGYKKCGRESVEIGSSWDCGIRVNWNVWSACIGAALICESQCAASTPSNWKKCYACWAAYIAACTGCAIRTCTIRNSTPLWGLEMIYATGACPDGSTGA